MINNYFYINKRIPSLDGLRALSIIMVIGSHILYTNGLDPGLRHSLLLKIILNGDLGVKIFFVISGFIITLLLLKEEAIFQHISLKNFYFRRFLRIIPTYYIFLLFILFLSMISEINIKSSSFLAAFTFTTGLLGDPTWILGHTWSLSVEEQFYLLWPVILVFIRKTNYRIIANFILIVLFPIIRVLFYVYGYKNSIPFLFITQGDTILFGTLSALLFFNYFDQVKSLICKYYKALRIISILLILIIYLMGYYLILGWALVPFSNTFIGISVALIILSFILVKDVIFEVLNNKISIYIGSISYGLYIWQQLFLSGENYWYTYFPINILLSFLIAILNYHFIEKKVDQIKAKLGNENIRNLPN